MYRVSLTKLLFCNICNIDYCHVYLAERFKRLLAFLETMVKITPWEVLGEVDYNKLIKEFGTEPLTDQILQRIERHTGSLHVLLRRKIFFSHRDLNWLLDEYEKGNKFYLYTGRGPSGGIHLGHLIPLLLTKWLQKKFKCEVWFQLTDDEKFLFNEKLSLEETKHFAYENILDLIALGFNPKYTKIFLDTEYSKTLYLQAIRVAKKLTFSTTKAVFGFKNENNVGQIFFTSMQAVPAFLPSVLKGKNIPCLIPYSIDQDPHFRIARDILPKLGFYKPAAIHSMFLPGLKTGGKMSASNPESAIFTTDTPEEVNKKISRAFTGGKETIKQQREEGGNPDICSIFRYFYMFFEENDKSLNDRLKICKGGEANCSECKLLLSSKINVFLAKHQNEREKAKKKIEKFVIRD